MSSKVKKDRPIGPATASSEDVQAWQQTRSHLRALERGRAQVKSVEEEIDRTRADLERMAQVIDYSSPSFVDKKQVLITQWDRLRSRTVEEQQLTSKALESLNMLLALRAAAAEENAEMQRKRRRIEESPVSSVSPPPALVSPPMRTESLPDTVSTPSSGKRVHSNSTTSKPEKPPVPRRNTTSKEAQLLADKMDPAKARREALAHQLPLMKGRRVAFRQPNKAKGGGSAHAGANNPQPAMITGDEEGETWIMAVITECINNDRNRYVVQDAEDPATPTFNTTLKAIVPLPENISTLPDKDYPPGSQVMALYPDTSCFYKAVIKGGGPKMDNLTKKQKDKRQHELLNAKYLLEFDDDGGDIKSVPAFLVVERP
ncbi:unnamed protein product [Sympodiomycopsis kandeliae]